ncbi:hypothetical protein GCM10009661_66490 [Catellatospora chokoriensis]|uniref:Type IV secretory system Conjugative DNA transfer n=1 Tax=Catellatospora chokoriensis TaxID=310353 RepID=A0A8J3K0F1_9ACTN|nr:type IV secretory system conjugative DNA transfer family protein [Catellatospora chokoriensis]GIF90661.1 hypothetical protein Cch02nite_41050 [Catellatospora chokoriensis]
MLRPTAYGDVSWWERRRIPWRELGFRVVRVGRQWVYTSYERMVLLLAPTQAGKTVTMANFLVDARGAAVATTTKVDLVDLTVAARVPIGPVYVFNPEQLGDGSDRYRSNLRWNPIIGCEDPTEARQRAANMVAGARGMGGVGDREFWEGQAVRVLGAALHAAALGGATMMDVLTWVSRPEDHDNEVRSMLRRSLASEAMIENWSHLASTNVATRTSITTGVIPALEWLQDPTVAAVALGAAEEQFDVAQFIREKGTLYLLANDREHGGVAPLFSALVSAIFEQAKLLSTRQPGGRLDPGLSLTLDEVANMCPLPLHRIASDSAGRGITMQLGFQSKAQMAWKWGEAAAQIIWDQAGLKLIFGGYSCRRGTCWCSCAG